MTIEAELPDGTVLEFPDGTDQAVIQRVVRQQLGVGDPGEQPAPAAATAPQAPAETSLTGLASNLGGGFNAGLAQVLGLPVDLVNAALGMVGAGSDQPVGGSAQLQGLIEGTPLAGAEPQTFAERMTRRVGEEIGATAVPIGAAGAVARGGRAATSALGRAVTQPFQAAPAATTATELGLASSAGAGAGLAQEVAPGSTGAELAGQVAGGLGPSAATSLARGAARGFQRNIRPIRGPAVQREAAERLQTTSIDPDRAVANIERNQALARQTPGLEVETAALAGDPGISALQKQRTQANPQLQGAIEGMRASANQTLRQSLDDIAPANDAGVIEFQAGVRQSVDRMLGAVDKRIDDAIKSADQQISQLGTGRGSAEASDATRAELQAAATEFTQQARLKFDQVDPFDTVETTVDKITAAIRGIRRNRSPAENAANFPSDIVQALGRIAPRNQVPASPILGPGGQTARPAQVLPRVATFKDIRAFRSRILDEIRLEESRIPSNRRRTANLNRILKGTDETLDDIALGKTDAPSDAVERLRAANSFFKAGNDKFRKGPVGRVLRKGKLGDDLVPRSATIAEFFRAGKGSRESVNALTDALGDKIVPEVEDFVADDIFAKTVGTNGRIDPQRLRRWMTQHRQPLQSFPTIRQKLANAASAEDLVAERVGLRARTARDVDKGILGLVLNRDPEDAIKTVFSGGQATQRMRRVFGLVKGNAKAERGLRRGIWDHLADSFERGPLAKRKDITGTVFLRPESMQDFIKRHTKTLMAAGYTPQQIRRLKIISEQAEIARRGPSVGLPTSKGAEKSTFSLNQLLSRAYGVARGVVSTRFVASEVGSRVVNTFISRLSEERVVALLEGALVDPELARMLLLTPTRENAPKIVNRLGAFLAGTASTAAEIATPPPLEVDIFPTEDQGPLPPPPQPAGPPRVERR